MKKFILLMLLLCTNTFGAVTDLRLSTSQIFDVQWNISGGKLNTSGFNYIYASVNYATQTTSAARWTAAQTTDANSNGRYIGFFDSTTDPGTYGMAVFNTDGTKYKIINNTGSFRALADGAIFYNGNGMWGTLITTGQGYSNGSSGSWSVTQDNPTNAQLQAYVPPTTVPLASGQTATQANATATPVAPPNLGFESGNTSSWTISNTTGAANWNSGSGASVVTGLQHTPGGGFSWTVTPYGTYMLSVQPGSEAPTFDSMTTSLGLTASQNSAIKALLTQQSQTSGGDATPTNASWVKREMTLQAGVTYSIAWQYLSTDYTPFNDGSIITLVHKTDSGKVPTLNNAVRNYSLLGFTNPGTGDYSTDSYGATGWQIATFTVPADGVYTLGFAAFNLGDTALSPILIIDEMQGTTMLNGSAFTPVPPNPGTGAPSAGGGGSTPTWPSTSDITDNQLTQKNSAKARVASVGLGNRLYLEQKAGSSNNSVTVEQTGYYNQISGLGGGGYAVVEGQSNTVNVKQGDGVGRNLIEFSVTGNSNVVTLWQARSVTTGLQDGAESGNHYTGVNIVGGGNNIGVKQGNDGGAGSGHLAFVSVTGNTNTGSVKQSNNNEKLFFGVVGGAGNVFDIVQQNTGGHYFDLVMSGNGHTVTGNQKDSGSHKATVNLTNAGGASTVTLIQQGSTAQNISITQSCATLSGCSVSVTQGQ